MDQPQPVSPLWHLTAKKDAMLVANYAVQPIDLCYSCDGLIDH